MTVNKSYASMSLVQLKRERDSIQRQIEKVESQDRNKAMSELAQTARQYGFNLKELVSDIPIATSKKSGRSLNATGRLAGKVKAKRSRAKVPPKYRNPDNASETWTGRGLKPRWVQSWVKQGKSLDEIRI